MEWGIVGHKNQISFIRSMIDSGHTPHALLFIGQQGIGKGTVAIALARTLLCEEGYSYLCGKCSSCLEGETSHPDLFILRPDGSSIKIDQIRSIQSELYYRPSWGRHKVFVIDPVDAMTEQAQNSLLKSLEDPPDYATFILVAHTRGAVLPTVVSRCVQIKFNPISRRDIDNALRDKGIPSSTAHLLSGICCGSFSFCLQQEPDKILGNREQVIDWAFWLKENPTAVWTIGEALEKDKERLEGYIDLFILWYRDILRVKMGVGQDLVNQDLKERVRQMADQVTLVGIANIIEALLQLKRNLRNNASLRLSIDVALINMKRGMQSA